MLLASGKAERRRMPFPLKFHLRRQEYRLNSFNSLTPHILETAASENLRKLSFNIDMDAKVRELKVNRSAMRKN